MVDIGRISSKKWAIALLVFLCVSAVLFTAPWILSAFYESDPYGSNWDQDLMLKSEETEGNTTLWCKSGPCVACTSGEKADPTFKCSPTGYHKAQQCAKERDAVQELPQPKIDGNSRLDRTKDPIQENDQKPIGEEQGKTTDVSGGGDSAAKGRSLVTADDGSQKTLIYKTCIPQDVKEKLSVFGFEGVVLVCLLISAPAVHYRKKRSTSTQGLQRIPSSARF